jgi:HD domain
MNIEQYIKPENVLERTIIADPDFIEGAMWGKPRKGHIEGKVIYHIQDVLANVDKYSNETNRSDLRLIAIIHDTFKHKVDTGQPKVGENHHGTIARHFAEKFNLSPAVLDIIELHDDAYNAWLQGSRHGKWEKAKNRVNQLLR